MTKLLNLLTYPDMLHFRQVNNGQVNNAQVNKDSVQSDQIQNDPLQNNSMQNNAPASGNRSAISCTACQGCTGWQDLTEQRPVVSQFRLTATAVLALVLLLVATSALEYIQATPLASLCVLLTGLFSVGGTGWKISRLTQ